MNIWSKLILLHVNTDSQKLNTDQKFIGWAWSKMGVSGHRTLILAVSQKWADGINWFFFFHAGTNSRKLKVDLMIFGWARSKMFLGPWNVLYLENRFINLANVLNADCDAIIFC